MYNSILFNVRLECQHGLMFAKIWCLLLRGVRYLIVFLLELILFGYLSYWIIQSSLCFMKFVVWNHV